MSLIRDIAGGLGVGTAAGLVAVVLGVGLAEVLMWVTP